VFRVGEVEGSLVDAGVLKDVKVSGEQGEGDGAGDVDRGVLELAFDKERDGNEAAGGGLGEVSGPLVDADGADDLLGLRDLVHLGRGNGGGQGCGADDRAEKESSHGLLPRLDAMCRTKSYRVRLPVRLVYEAWMARRCWMSGICRLRLGGMRR
jgi:hypothetical protein